MPTINFSAVQISNRTWVGKLLRAPLRLIPREARVPILQGRLRGKWWVHGSSIASCWLGSYEFEKQALFERMVTLGSVVFDVGAHVGFYSLLASELVGANGKVFAFEPVPRNLKFLHAHLQINHISNVMVFDTAVSDSSGTALFDESNESSQGRLSSNGKLRVSVIMLDKLISNGQLPIPDFVKIDVEGAEWLVLTGAKQMLSQYRPTIFLATHGRDVHQQCCQLLELMGYTLKGIGGNNVDDVDEIVAYGQKR